MDNHDTDLIDLTLHNASASTASASADASGKQQAAELAAHGLRAPPADEQTAQQAEAIRQGQTVSADRAGGGDGTRATDETVHTTYKHPWLTTDRGFVKAGDLHVGERVVRLDGSTAVVAAERTVPGAADYYNLEVSRLHTFAVGASRYVVHNCGDEVGQVNYNSTDLSKEVVARRRLDVSIIGKTRARTGNYAAARLEDGTIITARSGAKHAEENLLKDAGGRRIISLYSERAPCAAKCAGLLSAHNPGMRISWSWEWNGADAKVESAIFCTLIAAC